MTKSTNPWLRRVSRLHADLGPRILYVVLGVDAAGGCNPTNQDEECEEDKSNDGQPTKNRLPVAKVCPLATSLARIALDGLIAELVVNHTAQGDAVAEELQSRDLGSPNEHRGSHEHNVFENSAEGEHERGCLSNLHVAVNNTDDETALAETLTKRTTATLSMKAHTPFMKNVKRPTW